MKTSYENPKLYCFDFFIDYAFNIYSIMFKIENMTASFITKLSRMNHAISEYHKKADMVLSS